MKKWLILVLIVIVKTAVANGEGDKNEGLAGYWNLDEGEPMWWSCV